MFFFLYSQLNLSDLKPTFVMLCLVDRSVKVSKVVVEDVLIQVEIFFYPIDFIILDTKEKKWENLFSIILGRSFFATSNLAINYRNGHLQLAFGNNLFCLNFLNQQLLFIWKTSKINFYWHLLKVWRFLVGSTLVSTRLNWNTCTWGFDVLIFNQHSLWTRLCQLIT